MSIMSKAITWDCLGRCSRTRTYAVEDIASAWVVRRATESTHLAWAPSDLHQRGDGLARIADKDAPGLELNPSAEVDDRCDHAPRNMGAADARSGSGETEEQ